MKADTEKAAELAAAEVAEVRAQCLRLLPLFLGCVLQQCRLCFGMSIF